MSAPSVVAIIAAYNEADIIGQVIRHLAAQGVSVYLLDDGSDDDTVPEAEAYVGRGVIAIERLQPDQTGDEKTVRRFDWEAILKRKELVARTLAANWFIHHDADELRESPWLHVTLADAIGHVDALGYNAIDFQLFNFWPTTEHADGGQAVCEAFPDYEAGEPWNRVQVKCWKNLGIPVDLVSSGGHEARFPGRNVCPIRFVLRHYPVRGESHGQRKVFVERIPRFLPSERERGWHVQYDAFAKRTSFLRDSKTLTPYDPVRVRFELALRHRGVEDLEASVASGAEQIAVLTARAAELRGVLEQREQEASLARQVIADRESTLRGAHAIVDAREQEAIRARQVIADQATALLEAQAIVDAREHEAARARQLIADQESTLRDAKIALNLREQEAENRKQVMAEQARALDEARAALETLQASASWRLTAPLRRLSRWLGRGR